MEWLAVITWLVIAAIGVVLGRWTLSTPGAGLAALASVGGFALTVLFIVTGSLATVWVAFGLSVLGIVAASIAAAWLVSGDREVSSAGQPAEELQAALTGLQLPLLAAVACMSLLVALDLVTATI